jgi:two-component system sensor histidine kinase TctE
VSAPLPSLRARLVWHVLPPLALLWLLGAALMAAVSSYFVQAAYDRALLDDAYVVASHVQRGPGGALQLSLTAEEMATLMFDQSEDVRLAVFDGEGRQVAGHPGLRPLALPGASAGHVEGDVVVLGRAMRAVTLVRALAGGGERFTVTVAQTTRAQRRLGERMLTYSIAPQLLLLLLLALWMRRAIGRDVRPLADLQRSLATRDAGDLSPLPVSGANRDVQGLTQAVNALLGRVDKGVMAQRELSGNVAHEMRTPLAGIRGLAELGLHSADPLLWREQLQQIHAASIRASHLGDQWLALALADEAAVAQKREPVRVDELVRQLVIRVSQTPEAADVDLGAESGAARRPAAKPAGQRLALRPPAGRRAAAGHGERGAPAGRRAASVGQRQRPRARRGRTRRAANARRPGRGRSPSGQGRGPGPAHRRPLRRAAGRALFPAGPRLGQRAGGGAGTGRRSAGLTGKWTLPIP